MSRSIAPLIAAGLLYALSTPLLAEEDAVVATVNGEPVTQSEVEGYLAQHNLPPQERERAVGEVIARELVYQDAVAKQLAAKPEVKQRLEELRRQVLLGAALQEALRANPVTEEALRKAYEEGVAQFDATEYKARHILLEKEAEAKAVIDQLEKGADFAKLAAEKSTDPAGRNGGDLGWFSPQQMVPPFSKALATLDKGKYTKQPVQTDFGWHVILLEDTRKAEPPALELVREKLAESLRQQHVAEYVQGLREKAKVEIK
jgi:peptidyl-prolyl cis-trans isomerase C